MSNPIAIIRKRGENKVTQNKFQWQANYGEDGNLYCNGLDQNQVQLESDQNLLRKSEPL